MKKKVMLWIFVFLAIPAILIGCSSKTTASPTTNPDLIYTAAAQTADVRLTQIFQSTPSATMVLPTPTFDPHVATEAAQTVSAMQTLVSAPTQTLQPTIASTTAPPAPSGDLSIYVADVTIPDGMVIAPGAAFTKTWRLQNAGTSTWTTSYSLAFISGDQMGSVTAVPLAQSVAPGAQIDISVELVAPTNPGTYQGYWKMKNASGQFFNESVYVLIAVGSAGVTPSPTPGTPVVNPTSTSTGIPSNPITSLTMAVDQGTFDGPCPHLFTFTATLTLNQGATLTYELEAGSETPGFVFDLPGPQTRTFDPGTYSIPSELTFTSSGTGWVRLHVTAPVNVTSNQAAFNLTCQP